MQDRKLYRSRDERMIAGVLGGLAEFVGADPSLVRIAYILFGVLTGVFPAIVLYVLAVIIVPEQPPGMPEDDRPPPALD